MGSKADLVIGIAMFARSLCACDFGLLPVPGETRDAASFGREAGQKLEALDPLLLIVGPGRGRGLGQDPGRSRPSTDPIPAAPYATFPTNKPQ